MNRNLKKGRLFLPFILLLLTSLPLHAGYKYIFEESDKVIPSDYEKYVRKGVIWGVGIKINMGKIIRKLF